jgi:crossover junction endodeoxyribonuclease RuvC
LRWPAAVRGRDAAAPLARRVLGIDPGSVITGWGVVEAVGNSLIHLAHGTVATAGAQGQAARLERIYRGLEEAIDSYNPDGVCVERVFFARNAQSALKLGQARGVAILAAARNRLTVHEYAAVEIKAAVVGYGHATKQQVQMMIASLLRLNGKLPADAADALAAAICHLHMQTLRAHLVEALPKNVAPLARKSILPTEVPDGAPVKAKD